MNTAEKLNRLSELQKEILVMNEEKKVMVESVLTDEIAKKLDAIDAEFEDKEFAVNSAITNLEAEIKQDVLHIGSTVKGAFLMAVWNKGRVSWESKGLEGFMVAHPEMAAFRSEGSPSVTLRKVGKGE